jgi:glycosyltransferase involved in cell wall biosynthesis
MENILYLIFSESPSSVVRAEIYKETFLSNGYKVSYYYNYSSTLNNYYKKIVRYKLLIPLSFLIRIIRKVTLSYKNFLLFNNIHKYDGVIVIKYISPDFLFNIRKKFKGKILYDFDDAIWLPMFFGITDFEKILKNVDFVSCDNSFLAKKSIEVNKKTFILNGPSAIEKFDKYVQTKSKDKIIIGWIGSPSTIFYLYSIYDALEQIGSKYDQIELLIVGSGHDRSLVPPFEKIKFRCVSEYDEQEMIRLVTTFDIGLYPLFKNELSLGRGSLKATIYMSAKVPVIAAKIGGENEKIIKDGVNGFLAITQDDWVNALEKLICDSTLRVKIGAEGHKFVKSRFSVESCFDQLYNNFLVKL